MKHVTILLQHALENVFLVVDVLLDMFSMMAIALNQNDVLPMSNLKRKRIRSNVLTGEIKLGFQNQVSRTRTRLKPSFSSFQITSEQ